MTRRTITDFKRDFEENIEPNVSDYHVKRIRRLIGEAETEARVRATEHIEGLERQVLDRRDEALRELTEIRDGFDDLSQDGAEARIVAAEYQTRMSELRKRQVEAEQQLAMAERVVEQIEAVEQDPIAWWDDLSRRMPHLMRDW